MQRAAEWLDRRKRLGREVFGRGGASEGAPVNVPVADIADLFRACLVALRMPDQADASLHRRVPFWRVAAAVARITRMLGEDPGGRELSAFLPAVNAGAPERELRCRAALASTLLAGLELAREGALLLNQKARGRPSRSERPRRRERGAFGIPMLVVLIGTQGGP